MWYLHCWSTGDIKVLHCVTDIFFKHIYLNMRSYCLIWAVWIPAVGGATQIGFQHSAVGLWSAEVCWVGSLHGSYWYHGITMLYTVYPIEYVMNSIFHEIWTWVSFAYILFMICCWDDMFAHILQGCFTGTGQSYDCVSVATLKDVGKIDLCHTTTKYKAQTVCIIQGIYRDHFVYVPSQWEMTLQCDVISHCLGTCTKW